MVSIFIAIYGTKLDIFFKFVIDDIKTRPSKEIEIEQNEIVLPNINDIQEIRIENIVGPIFNNETQSGITGCHSSEDVSLPCKLSEIIGKNKEFSLIKTDKFDIEKNIKLPGIPIKTVYLN